MSNCHCTRTVRVGLSWDSRAFIGKWKDLQDGMKGEMCADQKEGRIDVYVIYMYIIYTPNRASSITIFVQEAEPGGLGGFNQARDGASGTPGRARESVQGATAESGGVSGERARALGEPQGQFGLRGPFWVLDYSCPAVPPLFVSAKAAAWKLSIFPSAMTRLAHSWR